LAVLGLKEVTAKTFFGLGRQSVLAKTPRSRGLASVVSMMGSSDAALTYLSNSVMEEARADQDAKDKSL